jgi:hypothetical protein
LPRIELGGEDLTGVDGSTFLANLGFTYQQAFRDRMSLLIEYSLKGDLGTGKRSLIIKGVTAASTVKLGWLVRAWSNDRAQLGVSATVTNQSATVVDILGFAQGIIDSGRVTPENTIVRYVPTADGRAGLRFACEVTRFVGVMASIEAGYGESIERGTESQWFSNGGGLFNLDFSAISSIPIGLSLGGFGNSLGSSLDETIKGQRALVVGIGYIGRDDFDLGVEASYQRNPQRLISQPLQLATAHLNLKYYF